MDSAGDLRGLPARFSRSWAARSPVSAWSASATCAGSGAAGRGHFELFDAEGAAAPLRFLLPPARIQPEEIAALFDAQEDEAIPVVGLEPLIRMKHTQRAKDYPVVGELARLLLPEREIEWTTDPDRLLGSLRPTARARSASSPALPPPAARGTRSWWNSRG